MRDGINTVRTGDREYDPGEEDGPGAGGACAPAGHERCGERAGPGSIALCSANAEIYTAIGLKLKAASPLADTLLVTLANGMANSGYVPNAAAFGAYSFQVLGTRLKPGCAEDGIVNGIVDLIQASGR